jgi:prepilin-type N-terminal cleavage/methylation domain-containing protein
MRTGKRGFTLLELLIAISLMLVVMLMLHSMFINAQEIYLRAAQRVDVYSQARNALDMIEQDLLRMRTGQDNESINLRSLAPNTWDNPEAVRQGNQYSDLSDWGGAEDSQTTQIREFLSFVGTPTWWDRNQNRLVTADAMVVYYLRRRPRLANQPGEGAYLVRRVLQMRSQAELAQIGLGRLEATPLSIEDDELASFVYAIRVYTDDQLAFLGNIETRRFDLDILPECVQTGSPNSSWLWAVDLHGGGPGGAPGGPPPGQQQPGRGPALRLTEPQSYQRVEFGGIWSTQSSLTRGFPSARWNYPSVVVFEITMIDRNMARHDSRSGNGTYRTFTRAVQLPVSGPLFRLDEQDLELLRSSR